MNLRLTTKKTGKINDLQVTCINIYQPSPETIKLAVKHLQNDELVGIPTETVYGLGANAKSATAINKIYELKERPSTNPLIVHVAHTDMLEEVSVLQSDLLRGRVSKLSALWPGPLTLILPKHPSITEAATAGRPTVGVRIPNHKVTLELLAACKLPIAAPSANKSTRVSPTAAHHVFEEFGEKLPMIINGGNCAVGLESTILNLVSKVPTVVRPGVITLEELQDTLGEEVLLRSIINNKNPIAPGQATLHYSPKTPVVLEGQIAGDCLPARTALISFAPRPEVTPFYDHVSVLSKTGDLREVAARLFGTLRELDRKNFSLIVVEPCIPKDLGLAIMDRLSRAAASRGEKKSKPARSRRYFNSLRPNKNSRRRAV